MEKGNEVIQERDTALAERFWKEVRENPEKGKCTIIKNILASRAPRFFVTREEASRVCARICRDGASGRKGLKDGMFREICGRVRERVHRGEKFLAAVEAVIRSEAPAWYLKPDTALRAINRRAKKKPSCAC